VDASVVASMTVLEVDTGALVGDDAVPLEQAATSSVTAAKRNREGVRRIRMRVRPTMPHSTVAGMSRSR
jgi:hypothetical protein